MATPNEVRNPTEGIGPREQICVILASMGRSFAVLRMTRVLFL